MPETMGAKACLICGGTTFVAGPLGRLAANGQPPRCADCGSLKRHRIVRHLYDVLDDRLLAGGKALQFSNDPAAPAERFGSVEISVHGGDNSLDLTAIDRPDGAYDWVIANHVIEHVDDDLAALAEMLRIAGPDGIVKITAPSPSTRLVTTDWGYPDWADHGHYRIYGSDLPFRLASAVPQAHGIQVIGNDDVTGRWDVAYFFTSSVEIANALALCFRVARVPVLAALEYPN